MMSKITATALSAGMLFALPFAAPHAQEAGKTGHLNPPGLFDASARGYSQVTTVAGPMRLVHVAGQVGMNDKGVLPSGYTEQVEQAMKNLETALAAAGADITDVLKVNVYIVDHSKERLDAFIAAMQKILDGRPGPASTLIPVAALARPDFQFEIDAVAALADKR